MEYGHTALVGRIAKLPVHIDSWGAGPFCIRVNGKRVWFEDSARFGPFVLRRDGSVADRQPGEKNPFWAAYSMWVKAGRPLRRGVCAVWRKPKPGTYWIDEKTGLSRFLTDPDLHDGPYVRVRKPDNL